MYMGCKTRPILRGKFFLHTMKMLTSLHINCNCINYILWLCFDKCLIVFLLIEVRIVLRCKRPAIYIPRFEVGFFYKLVMGSRLRAPLDRHVLVFGMYHPRFT